MRSLRRVNIKHVSAALAAGLMFAVLFALPSLAGDDAAVPAPPELSELFGGPFTLTDHEGIERSDEDFHGQFVLLYFGYTFCPDICPTSLLEIAGALDDMGEEAERVVPVFVSLDPGRDTPELLNEFVDAFGERFVGLTGTEDQVASIVRAYRVHRVKVVPEWSEGEDDYLVDHSSLTFLLDPMGRVLTLFPHGTGAPDIAERTLSYLDATPGS